MSPSGIRAAGREIDALVAEKVMGYEVRRIRPTWYHGGGVEVLCFYWPGESLMRYSCDARSCNAMMYRNGVNDEDGTAEPLPFYSDDIAAAWEVVERFDTWEVLQMRNPDRVYASVTKWRPEGFGRATAETAPHAICLAALAAVGAEPPEGAPKP